MQQQVAHTTLLVSTYLEVSKVLRAVLCLRSPSLVTWTGQRGAFFSYREILQGQDLVFFFPFKSHSPYTLGGYFCLANTYCRNQLQLICGCFRHLPTFLPSELCDSISQCPNPR